MRPTITVCGSMDFFNNMILIAKELEDMGCSVLLPSNESDRATDTQFNNTEDVAKIKRGYVDEHLEKIIKSDAILVANFEKRKISGYIGSNTLIELAFAYAFHKPIIVLNKPGEQPCKLEVLGLQSVNLDGKLSEMKSFLETRQISTVNL